MITKTQILNFIYQKGKKGFDLENKLFINIFKYIWVSTLAGLRQPEKHNFHCL